MKKEIKWGDEILVGDTKYFVEEDKPKTIKVRKIIEPGLLGHNVISLKKIISLKKKSP